MSFIVISFVPEFPAPAAVRERVHRSQLRPRLNASDVDLFTMGGAICQAHITTSQPPGLFSPISGISGGASLYKTPSSDRLGCQLRPATWEKRKGIPLSAQRSRMFLAHCASNGLGSTLLQPVSPETITQPIPSICSERSGMRSSSVGAKSTHRSTHGILRK